MSTIQPHNLSKTAMMCGWEGNHESGAAAALAVRDRLRGLSE